MYLTKDNCLDACSAQVRSQAALGMVDRRSSLQTLQARLILDGFIARYSTCGVCNSKGTHIYINRMNAKCALADITGHVELHPWEHLVVTYCMLTGILFGSDRCSTNQIVSTLGVSENLCYSYAQKSPPYLLDALPRKKKLHVVCLNQASRDNNLGYSERVDLCQWLDQGCPMRAYPSHPWHDAVVTPILNPPPSPLFPCRDAIARVILDPHLLPHPFAIKRLILKSPPRLPLVMMPFSILI